MIFYEYALDAAAACHARGLKTVAVTAGYMHAGPRAEFFAGVDAANVDLKAFSDDFYHRLAAARLEPVLDTLKYLRRETNVWLEITTLLIPGENDLPEEIDALTRWVANELGAETPLHFSAFHPDYRLLDHPPTPKATLVRAREQGRRQRPQARLSRQRPRPRRRDDVLRRLRRAADPPRWLRDRDLWARRFGRVPGVRNQTRWPLRVGARTWGNRRLPVDIEAWA